MSLRPVKMPVYRHYSFDLWLTLIKSNPLFKTERTIFFFNHFNYQKKSVEEVGAAFRQVDLMCNSINERTGKNIDADEMYLMVISTINGNSTDLGRIDTEWLYEEMEKLLFEHLPVVYCPRTIEVLDHLKNKRSSSISLLSNTGFIKGKTLRKVLERMGIHDFFDFQLFSDETGMSKPNKNFFKLMLDTAFSRRPDCELKDILHVGDNPKADIEGAIAAGIKGQLVNSNQTSITCLLC